ncbi:MAG: Fur family transcriptional regulator [Phycisphaerae bacterium]
MKRRNPENLEQLLSRCGLRKTRQRLGVLKVLADAAGPLTAEEIGRVLRRAKPDKVTIYRTLESFVEVGLVHRAYLQDRTSHYELSHNCSQRQCHPHFTCTSCGATRCMIDTKVEMVRGIGRGFVIHRQQVRLEGLCPDCA